MTRFLSFILFFNVFINAAHGNGDENCQSCHAEQWQDWTTSHHAHSMNKPSAETVLGDFADREVVIHGVKSKFFKKDNNFWVYTEDIQGSPKTFQIEYTFGIYPLQQYLVKTVCGKYQMLPFSWDARPAEEGGQKWFHIYGQEPIAADDRLHWMQPLQNWNGMCADCHSTNLKRNYNSDKDSFQTSWREINVSCLSCHKLSDDHGNKISEKPSIGSWLFGEEQNTAHWTGKKHGSEEMEVCASCHALRAPLTNGFTAGDKFLDNFQLSLPLPPAYHADGQIKGEDYVFGSFLQSKMYDRGVTCSNCHDPHSLKLKEKGNDLCTQCHRDETFNRPSHHKHKQGSEGAQCVNCHMPEQTYMQVDPRRDHSFKIPRPDLSQEIGSPNACTTCHEDKDNNWALSNVINWFGKQSEVQDQAGYIFHRILQGDPAAGVDISKLLARDDLSDITRASAYSLLASYPVRDGEWLLRDGLAHENALIRSAAARGTLSLPLERRLALLTSALKDDVRAVRIEAARALSGLKAEQATSEIYEIYQNAVSEIRIANQVSSWRAEGRMNQALLGISQCNMASAEQQYLSVLNIDPFFTTSYVGLAELYRGQGDDAKGGELIREALTLQPKSAELNFSYGFYLIRSGDKTTALEYLAQASALEPQNTHYAYVHAVALNGAGHKGEAYVILRQTMESSSYNSDVLSFLFTLAIEKKDLPVALESARKLRSLFPQNARLQQQIKSLEQRVH